MTVAGRVRGDGPVDELQQGAEILAVLRQRPRGHGLPVGLRHRLGHRTLSDPLEIGGNPLGGGCQLVPEDLRRHGQRTGTATQLGLVCGRLERAVDLWRCRHGAAAPSLGWLGRMAMIQNDASV